MDPIELIELFDCPICGGPGVMFDEGGWALNVQCCDCGAHTAVATYKPEDRMEVAKAVAAEGSDEFVEVDENAA